MNQALHFVCPHCMAINRVPSQRLREHPQCGQCHQALFTGDPTSLNTGNFARYLERNDVPVVVDFWAAWCGPCRMMAPHFAQVARSMEPAMRFAKLDTEAEQGLAARYQIRSIPTLIVFKNGHEIARQSGAMTANALQQWLQAYLPAI